MSRYLTDIGVGVVRDGLTHHVVVSVTLGDDEVHTLLLAADLALELSDALLEARVVAVHASADLN